MKTLARTRHRVSGSTSARFICGSALSRYAAAVPSPSIEPVGWDPRRKRNPKDYFWPLLTNGLRLRCPVCKRGRIFPHLMRMAKQCPACGITLEREPGYFLGSIYFNYGATCALAMATFVVSYFALAAGESLSVGLAVAITMTFPFWFWRYARSAWLVFDQYFDPREIPPAGSTSAPGESAGSRRT